jgi:muramoyltetrapeptide carboxypeptidase
MKIISPKRLHKGDRVAIVAPAAQFNTDELLQGMDVMKHMGLKPVLGPSARILNATGVYDAPLEDRVKELMWAFESPDVEGIFCVIGGFGSAELLPHLNFSAIRASRKAFVGKSDITALNVGILKQAGLINFNGKTAMIRRHEGGDLMQGDVDSLEMTLELLMSDAPWGARPLTGNQFIPRTICPGRASGMAVGGNLETLTCLLGTPYFPDLAGTILFIEDVHKSGINVARRLLHLKMAGVLDKVAAVVVGEFADVPAESKQGVRGGLSIADALQEFLKDIPSVFGYSFSHGNRIMPIPVGSMVHVDTSTGEIFFDFQMA